VKVTVKVVVTYDRPTAITTSEQMQGLNEVIRSTSNQCSSSSSSSGLSLQVAMLTIITAGSYIFRNVTWRKKANCKEIPRFVTRYSNFHFRSYLLLKSQCSHK